MAVAHDGSYPSSNNWLAIPFSIPAGINLLKYTRLHLPIAIVGMGTGKVVTQFMGYGTECPRIGEKGRKVEVYVGKTIAKRGADGIQKGHSSKT
jgi:hypothetical protein